MRFLDGSLGTYIRFVALKKEPLGVIILPFYKGQILLLNHFYHATRQRLLEILHGFGEKDPLMKKMLEENSKRK